MMNIHRCRTATVITGLLLCGLATAVSIGPLTDVASAATSPSITATLIDGGPSVQIAGSGFTPGGQVRVEVDSGTAVISSTNVVASESSSSWVCVDGVKPACHEITIPGGAFETTLELQSLGCGAVAQDTVKATDLSTGSLASEAVLSVGFC
jgi:hypothetical protein